MPPKLKSRLVVRGDLEANEIRSDSPTLSSLGQCVIFSFAACRGYALYSGDISSAYLQGAPVARKLLLSAPRGGIPGVPGDAVLRARVPIYGTRDAGRGFYKVLRAALEQSGLRALQTEPALYVLERGGETLGFCGTHVDDVLWAGGPEMDDAMEKVKAAFGFGKIERDTFRYCGKAVSRNPEGDVLIACEETLRRIDFIDVPPGRAKQPDQPCTENERTQLRSVAGSLIWCVRQNRPDLAYEVNQLQVKQAAPRVADLLAANRVLGKARADAGRTMRYRAKAFDWDAAAVYAVSDASHGGEEDMLGGALEPHRSQSGRIILLASPALAEDARAAPGESPAPFPVHFLEWSSKVLRRVCRSTLQAEAYSLTAAVESAGHVRALLAEARGPLPKGPELWDFAARAGRKLFWMTDCRSLHDTLVRTALARVLDKRLSLELCALRQDLWRDSEPGPRDPGVEDDRPPPERATDEVIWIDTQVMLSDSLTKACDTSVLLHAMAEGLWSARQPPDAAIGKQLKQAGRRALKQRDRDA